MIRQFAKTKFFLSVAHKQFYEQGFTFNESNIVAYLAELEEYIAILITYLATKRDDPVAPFALVPLDKLDAKNHNKKEIAVCLSMVNFFLDRSTSRLCGQPGQCPAGWTQYGGGGDRDRECEAALPEVHAPGRGQHH